MTPPNIYALVGPAILALIVFEVGYCLYRKNGFYTFQDSLIGLGTAIIAQCVNLSVTAAVLLTYGWIYENLRIFEIPTTAWTYALCYLGVDFLFYWFHRAGHRINLFWAMHVPHHSAEELNYAVALRSSFTQRGASFLFYWPLAWLGFSPELILPVVALNLVIQLIPHTRVIPKLPRWIDSWLNTPYHHQVHHAANPMYWDKNYGGTFIFWDKWFGSYQDQIDPIYYGVTEHPKSWDPTYLNFHWFHMLWKDACAADRLWDKVQIWFRPPGWRPRNLPRKPTPTRAPEKYRTQALPQSKLFLGMQLFPTFALMFWVIGGQSPLSALEKFFMTLALWVCVTSWGAILESRRSAPFWSVSAIVFTGWLTATYQQDLGHSSLAVLSSLGISVFFLIWLFRLTQTHWKTAYLEAPRVIASEFEASK